MEKLIAWSLATLVSAFVGSYLAGYLRKKGENLATHEDLEKLVEQMKAVTLATKEIEANISDKVWNRQKHWELKRDAVYAVMQALGRADEALHLASVAILGERTDSNGFREAKLEAWDTFYREIDDFDAKRAMALIVCGKMMNDTLMTLKHELKSLALQLGGGEITCYEDYKPDLAPVFARAFAAARQELGIVREGDSDK